MRPWLIATASHQVHRKMIAWVQEKQDVFLEATNLLPAPPQDGRRNTASGYRRKIFQVAVTVDCLAANALQCPQEQS